MIFNTGNRIENPKVGNWLWDIIDREL